MLSEIYFALENECSLTRGREGLTIFLAFFTNFIIQDDLKKLYFLDIGGYSCIN